EEINMGKVLVEVFFTYGKRAGRELGESYVETDSKELREGVLEEGASNSLYIEGDVESFKEGFVDRLDIDRVGGDWDESTGVEIVITKYSQKREEIERKYNKELEKLHRQFGMEETI